MDEPNARLVISALIGVMEFVFIFCIVKYYRNKEEYDRRYWGKNSLKPQIQEMAVKAVLLFLFWLGIMFVT